MAQVPPPRENVSVFNSLNYFSANTNSLANKLDYPTAQGLETFPNGIQFGDGTVQSTAVQPADISGATNPLTSNLNAADFDITDVDDIQVSTINLNSQGGVLSSINVSAPIDMGGNAITNVANVAGSSNVATQQFVTDEVEEWSQYPATAGNPVDANSQRVINVADPSNNSDAVNLSFFNEYVNSSDQFQPIFWSSQMAQTGQYTSSSTSSPSIDFSVKSGATTGSYNFLTAHMNFKLTVRVEVWQSWAGGTGTYGYFNVPSSTISSYFTVWPGRMYYAGVWSGSSSPCYLFNNSGGDISQLESVYPSYTSVTSSAVGIIYNQGTYINTNNVISAQDSVYCYGTNNRLQFICQNPYVTNNPSQTVNYYYTLECQLLNVNSAFNDQFSVEVKTSGQTYVIENNFLPFSSSL